MFTGIIEEVGIVKAFNREGDRARITISAKTVLEGTKYGDSINVEGVCQTVAQLGSGTFTVFTLAESLKKTTLGSLRSGSKVNLERAMTPDTRMGGHMVQGHVSAVVPITDISRSGENVYLSVEIPDDLIHLCVNEGSIALDGMSLTIARISTSIVTVNIIPVTMESTTLLYKKAGGTMNLETDIIGRYIANFAERYFAQRGTGQGENSALNFERLRELGY